MINFEEELKKFKPSIEIEDAEDAIYNQDLDDMTDVLVKFIKEAHAEADTGKGSGKSDNLATGRN
ncbi:MAG: hypothetical protein K5868_07000 [Lachnospiraceae bacterium]|nr:hypothetical protein [Lachnospiraceae bacterium]